MQPGAVGQPGIDEGASLVQPPSGGRGEPLSQPPYVVRATHPDSGADQAGAPVDPYLVGVDQDVGDRRISEQRSQRAGTGELIGAPVGQAYHRHAALRCCAPSSSSSRWHSSASGPRPSRAGGSPRSSAPASRGSARNEPASGSPNACVT